jgi:hypothetical protein
MITEGEIDESYDECKDLVAQVIAYFDGNEVNELIVDPLIILSSV